MGKITRKEKTTPYKVYCTDKQLSDIRQLEALLKTDQYHFDKDDAFGDGLAKISRSVIKQIERLSEEDSQAESPSASPPDSPPPLPPHQTSF